VSAALAVALVVAGCSSKGNTDIVGAKIRGDAGEPDAPRPLRDAAPSHTCSGPGYPVSAGIVFSHLSATVVDTNGAPVPTVTAQTCGINLCLNGATNENGFVSFDQAVTLDQPAFKYGDARGYARFALPLTAAPIDVDLGNETTVAFEAPATGAPLTPGTTATSAGVSLELAPDMNPVAPDPFDFDTDDLKKFRAAKVPIEKAPAAVDPSFGFEIVVALTPEGTVLCPAAKMTVANDAGLPPNTPVEFFLHGVDVAQQWAPYGGWAKISDGVVSADGATVTTDDSGGLPALSVVGIRRAKD
jgi:hypothetical protein